MLIETLFFDIHHVHPSTPKKFLLEGYSKFLIFHKLMSLRLHYFSVTSSYVGGQVWSVSLSHFLPRQYLKNVMMDEIQSWHVDVTGTQGVPYFKVTLNSH